MLKKPKLTVKDLLRAQAQVKAVHNCPVCQAYLEKIKEHQERDHKDV